MLDLLTKNTHLSNTHKKLFLAIQSGEASAEEQEHYARLKRESSTVASEFEAMEIKWRLLFEYPIELDSAFDIDFAKTPKKEQKYWAKLAIAATIACLSILVLLNNQDSTSIRYQTAYDQQNNQQLNDNSTVHLNASSTIEVVMTNQQRRVILKRGEALFTVAKDPNRKFIVETPLGDIQAIGTQFNVNLLSDQLVVTVVEGTVMISTPTTSENIPSKAKIATANQQVKLNKQLNITFEEIKDITPSVTWLQGKLVFSGQPLSQVLEMAGRHSQHKITILDAQLNNLPIYGVFNNGDIDGLLAALEHSFPLVAINEGPNSSYLAYRNR